MTLKNYLGTQGLSFEEFKNLDKETKRRLRKEHAQKNNEEQIERTKQLQTKYKAIEASRYADTTDEEIYKSMYLHLVEVFGSFLERHECSGELKLTRRYLKKYCKSNEQYNRLTDYVKNHGGYCDCEVLLNCPSEMLTKKED